MVYFVGYLSINLVFDILGLFVYIHLFNCFVYFGIFDDQVILWYIFLLCKQYCLLLVIKSN